MSGAVNIAEGPLTFMPDFEKGGGLIAAVAQDAATGEVLMLAWMNREAWEKTLETGEAHYYSRSRRALWRKGESLIEQIGGAACHEGYRSCFSREWRDGATTRCSELVFDPKEVYA